MKTKLLFLLLIISNFSFAQMDDKFYQPSKKMKTIENLNYTDFKIPVEKDTITGILIKPNTKKIKATVLFFHGAGGNVSTYTFMTKPLSEAGYQIYMVDFRGYGKSTGTPSHQNVESDAQKFLEYAMSFKQTKRKPIIVYGASLGSQIATHLAKNNPTIVDALVLEGAMSSFNDIAIHFAPQAEQYIKNIPFPYAAKEDIKDINIPKLIIHSEGDKTVPIFQGKTIFENASGRKIFLNFEGDHLEALVKNKDEVLSKIKELIKK